MKRVGLIGLGAIGAFVVREWRRSPPRGQQLVGICARPAQAASLTEPMPDGTTVVTDVAELLAMQPDILVEAAGHAVLESWGERFLDQKCDLCVLSVGALSDPRLRRSLIAAAERTGSHIKIPAGALAGFDGLLALARSGLKSVRYTSIKPSHAWIETPAAAAFDLAALTQPTVIFSGNAAEAARLFPKNANLAAAVALAGLGFEDTLVELVADPTAEGNRGLIEARGLTSSLRVDICGEAARDNPKTSAIVGASVISSLANASAALQFV